MRWKLYWLDCRPLLQWSGVYIYTQNTKLAHYGLDSNFPKDKITNKSTWQTLTISLIQTDINILINRYNCLEWTLSLYDNDGYLNRGPNRAQVCLYWLLTILAQSSSDSVSNRYAVQPMRGLFWQDSISFKSAPMSNSKPKSILPNFDVNTLIKREASDYMSLSISQYNTCRT